MITQQQKELLRFIASSYHDAGDDDCVEAIRATLDALNAQADPVKVGRPTQQTQPVGVVDHVGSSYGSGQSDPTHVMLYSADTEKLTKGTELYAAPPAARELSDEEERAAFEKAAVECGVYTCHFERYTKELAAHENKWNGDICEVQEGQYRSGVLNDGWKLWQARAVLAAKVQS